MVTSRQSNSIPTEQARVILGRFPRSVKRNIQPQARLPETVADSWSGRNTTLSSRMAALGLSTLEPWSGAAHASDQGITVVMVLRELNHAAACAVRHPFSVGPVQQGSGPPLPERQPWLSILVVHRAGYWRVSNA